MLTKVAELADGNALPRPVYVQHGHTPFSSRTCVATAFMTRDQFDERIADAELVLVHGGVTSVQAIRAGKLPVVMPRKSKYREHIDDHQSAFVRVLEAKGLAIVAEEPDELPQAIADALAAQADRGSKSMSRGEPPLVRRIAETLVEWNSARMHTPTHKD
jgi:UDP-N-acetylglucosamine transferase subunit ALG13